MAICSEFSNKKVMIFHSYLVYQRVQGEKKTCQDMPSQVDTPIQESGAETDAELIRNIT